jgi:hypothetical protein
MNIYHTTIEKNFVIYENSSLKDKAKQRSDDRSSDKEYGSPTLSSLRLRIIAMSYR